MNAADWKKLFVSIRPEEQSDLVVSISGGIEIAVQQISRPEDSVVLIRGRVQGQAEIGRVFIVPYENINLMYVNRVVLNEEVDLYSPSTSLDKKKEIVKHVAEIEAKNREAARQAESSKNQGLGGAVPIDVRRQLDALKEMAQSAGALPASNPLPAVIDPNKAQSNPALTRPAAPQQLPNPNALPNAPQRMNLPSPPKPK